MQRAPLVIAASVALSAAASLLLVTATRRDDVVPPTVERVLPASVLAPDELRELRRRLDELEMEVAALRQEGGAPRMDASAPVATDEPAENEDRTPPAAQVSPAAYPETFKAQVADVLAQIEEEKEAERREAELARRREEAVKANAEYDTFDAELDTRLTSLREALYLDANQTKTLKSLLAIQNERNREMTRLWSEGNTSKEEIGKIFAENRAAHRRDVVALLGPEQLRSYRKLVANGKLGGRFAFFVGPKEDWAKAVSK